MTRSDFCWMMRVLQPELLLEDLALRQRRLGAACAEGQAVRGESMMRSSSEVTRMSCEAVARFSAQQVSWGPRWR